MSSSARQPRAKPWEVRSPDSPAVTDTTVVGPRSSNSMHDGETSENGAPELPQRPAVLESDYSSVNQGRGTMGYQNSSMYGHTGGYGGSLYGTGGGYGSAYGIGNYGSMYGGGGYGSMYGGGGYGSMMGGYGSGGMYGMGGVNNNGPQGLAESTQATFQLIESLIGAVAGFAQMLEATYMATHNSFFTMVSMAEQFSSLKEMLGSFFGIFAAMKMLKRLLYKIRGGGEAPTAGTSVSAGPRTAMAREFEEYRDAERQKRKNRRISWKPLLVFLAAVFGFPFLLRKFIAKLAEIQRQRLGNAGGVAASSRSGAAGTLDPKNLEFARALYDFTPENPEVEVLLRKGDLMAIIGKTDPVGRASEWWKVRTRKGDVGYVPFNYLELIRRKPADATEGAVQEVAT
ncbi:LADA_0D08746g1_1 [Lachancea dasiensis]|uniref:Peroxisomal membrane protein PEX13 n=1 Tax=Lachancea dasiensis TaxID=1072105 RepID=A0A1G4J7Q5_9SACH|nr:LADA_0D08746g1_1 [Lachancea dasiensis]